MKKWNRWIWLVCLMVVFISANVISHKDSVHQINEVRFHVSSPIKLYLVNEEDLKAYLYQYVDILEESRKNEVSLFHLERILEEHSHVKNAEVYYDRVSNIHVNIDVKQPLLRYLERGSRGFYIDEFGDKIEWTPNYTPRLIVVRGKLPQEIINDTLNPSFQSTLEMIALCGKKINNSSYLQSIVDEISFLGPDNIQLVSKIGNAKVLLGDTTDLDAKLDRFAVFYKEAYARMGWEKYRQVDVRFKEKVYCR